MSVVSGLCFFFKQKTAYEMRISDWSSDVCSSDLGENPYFAYLGLADAILVTADSVNMVCEAASTGKPVYVIDLDGSSDKFRSEARRVGTVCDRKCRSRGSADH